MILLIFTILTILMLIIIDIKMFKSELFYPFILLKVSMVGPLIIYLLFYESYQLSFSELTAFLLIAISLLITFTHVIANKIRFYSSLIKPEYNITRFHILIITILFVIVIVINYLDLVRLASYTGYTGGLERIIQFARLAVNGLGISRSRFSTYGTLIARTITYVIIYISIYRTSTNLKTTKLTVIPILLYLVIVITTTGRNEFIYLIVYILFLLLLFKNKHQKMRTSKVYFNVFLILIIGSFIFYLIGFLSGKSGLQSFLGTIFVYGGSSIYGLNNYLLNFRYNSENFGIETLGNFYQLLNMFGANLRYSEKVPLEFIHHYHYFGTNIYTSFRRYLNDFNYIGLGFMIVSITTFYTIFFNYVKRDKRLMSTVLLGSIYYPLIEIAIEERFLNNIIGTTTLYTIIVLIILNRIFKIKEKK